MLAGTRRRPRASPARKLASVGGQAPAPGNANAAAPGSDQPSAEARLQGSAGPRRRCCGCVARHPPRAPVTACPAPGGGRVRDPCWARTAGGGGGKERGLVGAGLHRHGGGRVAAKGRPPLMGIAGLLAAPLALTVANTTQKGIAAALNPPGCRYRATVGAGAQGGRVRLPGSGPRLDRTAGMGRRTRPRGGGAACGRRLWRRGPDGGGALGPTPLSPAALIANGVNELVFPVGCALVIFAAEALAKRLSTPRTQQPPHLTFAKTAQQDPLPLSGGVGSCRSPLHRPWRQPNPGTRAAQDRRPGTGTTTLRNVRE
jgi:hypothetical protein